MVKNDHVLAIVRIKGEELEKREIAMKESKMSSSNEVSASTSSTSHDKKNNDDDNDGDNEDDEEEEESALPKLTRAKAKALNKFPLPVAPIKHSEPDSEVVALISEELHSDDDDEEYQPGEDDIEVWIQRLSFVFMNFNDKIMCVFAVGRRYKYNNI